MAVIACKGESRGGKRGMHTPLACSNILPVKILPGYLKMCAVWQHQHCDSDEQACQCFTYSPTPAQCPWIDLYQIWLSYRSRQYKHV